MLKIFSWRRVDRSDHATQLKCVTYQKKKSSRFPHEEHRKVTCPIHTGKNFLVAVPELFKAAELLIRITSQLLRHCECSGCEFFGAFNFTRGFCESPFLCFAANNIHLFASCDIFGSLAGSKLSWEIG